MPASFPQSFYQTCTWPLPHVGPRRSMRNMSASLPRSFYQTYQTCTRPLPTLGQSETCETCQHRFQNIFIKHAQGLSPRWAKAKHTKHAGIASTKFISNMHKASSHVGPKRNIRNMPASLPQSFHQTCTRPLPTLGQSETCETCQHRFQNIFIKHAQGLSPRWAKAKHTKHAGIASTKFISNMHKASSHVGPKRNMRNMPAASLPKVSIKHAQGLFPRWAKRNMRNIPAWLPQSFHLWPKWWRMSPSATPATQSEGGCRMMPPSATTATRNEGGCCQVPRLPRKTKVDVAKCHACHAKRRCMSPSATLATQSDGCCRQVPRLPRKVLRRQTAPKRRPSGAQAAPKRRHQSQPTAISCNACHAKLRNEGGCRQVPRLPRETKVDVAKCHACHAKCRGVNGAQAAPKHATRASPVPLVPRLPRETKVDVAKCHVCHAKCRGINGAQSAPKRAQSQPSAISATPATRSEGGCRQVPRMPRKVPMSPSGTLATRNEGGCRQVPSATKLCVKDGAWQSCVCKMVCDKVVCERWCATKLCVKECVCVKDGVWQSCVWKMVCDKVVCERWCERECVKDGVWQSSVWKRVCER